MKATYRLVATTCLAWLMLSTIHASVAAAQLLDGTIVHVRLLTPINSEDTQAGERIQFVVTRDVFADGIVVIARQTCVEGKVVAARRASWGFIWHRALLAFMFDQTTMVDGQSVWLRVPNATGRITMDRSRYHHNLQWAGGGDTFEASVHGNYNLRLR
jgi:hypothetical protein